MEGTGTSEHVGGDQFERGDGAKRVRGRQEHGASPRTDSRAACVETDR